jgi:hypothetical protein
MIKDSEINEVLQIVGNTSNGVKISEVVDALAANCGVSSSRARYIVRGVLDRLEIRTDSKFRLHSNR